MTHQTNQFLQLFQFTKEPCILVAVQGSNYTLEAYNDSYQAAFRDCVASVSSLVGKQWHEESLLSALIPVERLHQVRNLGTQRSYEEEIGGVASNRVEYLPIKNSEGTVSHIIIRYPQSPNDQNNQEQYRILVQEGTELLSILDTKGNFKFLNQATRKLLGNASVDWIGTSAFECLHPDDKSRVVKDFKRVQHSQQIKIAPFRIAVGKGSWTWIETTAINKLNHPAVAGIITSSRDITRSMAQAREIENLNERYRLAATATQDVMYDWDISKNQVIKFHRNLTDDLLGYPVEEIEQDDFWSKQIHPGDYQNEVSKRKRTLANPSQTFIRSEYRFKREDGTYAKVIDR